METNKQFYEIQNIEDSNKNPHISNTIQIGIGLPKIKSHVKIGNMTTILNKISSFFILKGQVQG